MNIGSVADWLNVAIVAGLAGITYWYARTTAHIAREASRQAEAAQASAAAAQQSVRIMSAQWQSQELAKLLPIQLAVSHALTYTAATKRQVEQTHGGIHFGRMVSAEYDAAKVAARQVSESLYQSMNAADAHLEEAANLIRAPRSGEPDSRARSYAAFDSAAQDLTKSLEEIRDRISRLTN